MSDASDGSGMRDGSLRENRRGRHWFFSDSGRDCRLRFGYDMLLLGNDRLLGNNRLLDNDRFLDNDGTLDND